MFAEAPAPSSDADVERLVGDTRLTEAKTALAKGDYTTAIRLLSGQERDDPKCAVSLAYALSLSSEEADLKRAAAILPTVPLTAQQCRYTGGSPMLTGRNRGCRTPSRCAQRPPKPSRRLARQRPARISTRRRTPLPTITRMQAFPATKHAAS